MQDRFDNFSIKLGKVLAGKFPVSAPFEENQFRDKGFYLLFVGFSPTCLSK